MNETLKTAIRRFQAATRAMMSKGAGKVIDIVSMPSFQGDVRMASYAASESGVAGPARLPANEWATKGINVNAIAPGHFSTSHTQALRADEARHRSILERIPAGRRGQPSDLGGPAVFLASAALDHLPGVILPVDGGWLAR